MEPSITQVSEPERSEEAAPRPSFPLEDVGEGGGKLLASTTGRGELEKAKASEELAGGMREGTETGDEADMRAGGEDRDAVTAGGLGGEEDISDGDGVENNMESNPELAGLDRVGEAGASRSCEA